MSMLRNAADKPSILVADDQPDILEALRMLLKNEGFLVQTASSPPAVINLLDEADFDLVLMDLNYTRDTTSGQEGLDLLEKIHLMDSDLPVVVITAWASVDLAVNAMQRGASDFVQKPWDNARLLSVVRNQIELYQAKQKGRRLEAENILLREHAPRLIAYSRPMLEVMHIVEKVAPSDANVLICGENGTGKGVIAQAIHAASPRSSQSMVTVNTGGLSEGVFESELFGHVKGAYTDAKSDRVGRFELADGGTLFLDEIANIPLNLQNRLLRVLETGEYERVGASKTRKTNARIISATNANLAAEVAEGRFRQDLLFRLNTIEIHLPPLRERREDIAALAMHFLKQHARKYRKLIDDFDPAAMQALLQHPWPGNIRELNHAIERSVLMANSDRIKASDLGLQASSSDARPLEEMSMEEVEAFLVRKALKRFEGNVSKAAEALGLSRSAFYRRMEKYQI